MNKMKIEKPTEENTPDNMSKEKIRNRIKLYEGNPEFLTEFIWHLMNNAWTDGYEEDHE